MNQTTLSQHGNSLLDHAITKLNPEVFSHPVLVRFGQKVEFASPVFIADLIGAAKSLERNEPSTACQILLICAVYQNRAGQHHSAIITTQQALALAQRTNLGRETTWAIWGESAIFVQQGNFEQAASLFIDLQAALSEQNEWILAEYVNELRQTFFQSDFRNRANHPATPYDRVFADMITPTFDWLQHWGFTTLSSLSSSGFEVAPEHSAAAITRQTPLPEPSKVQKRMYRTGAKSEPSRRNVRSQRAAKIVPVTVHMLGGFGFTIGDAPVKIPSSRSLSLLKYLLIHHRQKIPREILMDTFWPDAEPETARNSLNVAVHGLRKSIRNMTDLPLIVFEGGSYGLAPNLQVWLDADEFEKAHKTGNLLEMQNQLAAAIIEYECAISLYQGDFLEEDPYEEWTVLDRERFRTAYLDILDRLSQIYFSQGRYSACRSACQLILAGDPCREDAHCLLMRCYSRQGQQHLALYQYQRCVEALRDELDVEPAPETTKLYEAIRRRERV